MGCCLNAKLVCTRANFWTISLVLLLTICSTQLLLKVEARATPEPAEFNSKAGVNLEDKIMRAQIGSRPPRCQRRCSSCGHCEAIQVPTNPTINGSMSFSAFKSIAYARGDDGSNYKPMSWKCKCGSLIFNP